MQLNVFRTLWGVTTPWQQTVSELQSVGCCGIEARVPLTTEEQRTMARRLEASALQYIAIVFSGGGVIPAQAETPAQHLERLKERFAAAKALNPRFVNLLAGNDRWPLAQQVDFLGRAHELAAEYELLCSFETHRATSLYSPWLTLEIIQQLPQLRFTADISHWIVVSERLLDDPCDDFSAFIERVHHIQARAGYDQGPQVPHPAAPEYQAALRFQQRFWEQIWQSQRRRGYQHTTLTPEFGPDGYLHHLPFTNVPVADLWSLNAWMARREQQHFVEFTSLTA
ncbi:TPA: sugar phosphate isomerase/epimerase family protein [Klebsiella oxytoca]|uniref:sugar phosphate isomerase/epimerase family protein n=1 Tax=Klebsiella oxytoca TaxID=571 RepID=UPI00388EDE05|nr:sugar phosphate isomerase/epimerase [Klebsiella oxytoca]HCC6323619.1 sugar phosphate isomerase/epimerase [Klebsiella oxytoca]